MNKTTPYIFIYLFLSFLLNFSNQKKHKLTRKEKENIKKSLFIDSYMLSQNELFYNQTHSSKREKEKRKVEQDEITLTDVGFFSYDLAYATRVIWSYGNLFGNIEKDKTKYILYPYSFTYKTKDGNENEIEKTQNKGGFFTLNPNILPSTSYPHYFDNLKDITSVQISKSKALYDIDIGILIYETNIDGMTTNLFSEADLFCTFFVQRLGKASECIRDSTELAAFRKSNPNKGAVMLISPSELVKKDILFKNGLINFGLLIIPDHVYDTEDIIKNELTQQGIDKIKKFVDNGGNILATGKSGYILEKFGIISDSGFYQTKKYLYSLKENTNIDVQAQVSLSGCEDIPSKTPSDQPDYFKQVMCMNMKNKIYLTSAYVMNKDNVESNENWKVIMSLNSGDIGDNLKYKNDDGSEESIGEDNYFPIVLTKQDEKKGRIIIINGNLFVNTDYTFQLIMDTVFYSMGRNVIFDAYIKYSDGVNENMPIPGGEEGVRLNCYFKFLNLFETPINDITVDIFAALKTKFIKIPDGCEKITNDKKKYSNVEDMDISTYIHCNLNQLQKYSDFSKEITIEITDQSVTQKASEIPIFHPFLEYSDSESGEKIMIDHGAVEVTASLSAILRVTANASPGGKYPLRGRGLFFDQVFNVENKENTEAKDVNLITIIPLVSLVVGGSDQTGVIHSVDFYDDYYKKHEYTYPWTQTGGDYDYLDYAELSGKDIVFSTDWDHPVKQFKVQRADITEGEIKDLFKVEGTLNLDIEESSLLKSNNQMLLKELYFKDADLFYEVAKQRRLVFIDTSKTNGAQAYYKNEIPEEKKDPADPSRAKINVIFSRVDLYFKYDRNYQIPDNVNENITFTIDKYDGQPTKKVNDKIGKYKADKKVDEGFYSTKNNGKLIPDEYYNVLKQHNIITDFIDPLDENTNITEQFPDMKLSHYLVLIKGDRISRAGSIEGFIEDEGSPENFKTGYLQKYPSVKFIFAHTVSFLIDKSMTRLGGKFIINLGTSKFKNSKLPSENDFVTMSVDGVAIYKMIFEYLEGQKNIIYAYFKRGLMPDETNGKDSTIQLNIENLTDTTNIDITIELYELKYDLSERENNFETYQIVNKFEKNYVLTYQKFWSLPCLIIQNKFKRNGSTKIKEYELIDPYARYTIYYQELIGHRTVWGTAQSNHFTNPGLQAPNGGFSLIGNIGTSSIPFADYVSHGALMIPSAISTSRIEWTDVWGRHWVQPIRSLFPDVPPMPSPYMDFMMSTTYEILQDGQRVLEWSSADAGYIKVHIKFFNNYFKYFNLAICKENQQISGTNEETDYISISHSNVYGTCYQNNNAFLSGRKITEEIQNEMTKAMLCAESGNSEEMLKCTEELKALSLPLLVKKKDNDKVENDENKWNYSPFVNSYYPEGYINEESMWDMTKTDYASDVYSKGYPWHFDNNLPGLEGNQKPKNLMAFPIFKGFGYKIEYSPTMSIYHHYNGNSGWWCDNLQNKDNTLLAGQSKVNTFPTIDKNLLDSSNWINGKNINSNEVRNRLKNRYVCEFNQHRIKIPSNPTRIVTPRNIYQNNIIPIYPDMDENDYTNFDCSNVYQYSPSNISLADNRVRTNTDRDWLYFALNLRGEAKETLNILLSLTPFSDRKYEGETKIQDGGRFTYWNPALGENAYIYLDNNVNVVRGYRVDYTIDVVVYPSSLNTFKTVNYHLFTIEDPKEELREYTSSTYTNSYGFGDSAVTVYVGGTEDSNFKIKPGETTYVKITFYNNAGFDWNMKGGAIVKDDLNIPSDKLMKDIIHSVKVPKEYKFMELEIPDEIKEYIEIVPSDHNSNVDSQFFDFQSINVVTIKDGFQGEYFYKLKLKTGLDEKYFGRIWEIKVNLKYDYFDMLPGSSNDPSTKVKYDHTMYHDYILKIPSIKFGIPYSEAHSNTDYRNKVFYTLGRGTDIKIIYDYYQELSLDDIKILTLEEVDKIKEASAVESNYNEELLKVWNEQITNTKSFLNNDIEATIVDSRAGGYKTMSIDLSKVLPTLPYEVYGQPDVTKFYVLVKLSAPQFSFGSRKVLQSAYVKYNYPKKERKGYVSSPNNRYVTAYGPWMKMDIEKTLLDYNETEKIFIEKENQNEIGNNGYMRLKITSKDVGSKDAYQTSYKFVFSKYAEIIEDFGALLENKNIITLKKDNENGDTILYINSQRQIPQNTKDTYNVYIKFDFGEEEEKEVINYLRRNLDEDTNEKVILKSADVTLCQNIECNNDNSFVNQNININFKIAKTIFPINEPEKQNELIEETKIKTKEPTNEDEESVSNNSNEEENKSIAWIAAPIIACIVVGLCIFLYIDYKKKLLIFKKSHESIASSESNIKNEKNDIKEKTENIRIHSIRNIKNSSDLVS